MLEGVIIELDKINVRERLTYGRSNAVASTLRAPVRERLKLKTAFSV